MASVSEGVAGVRTPGFQLTACDIDLIRAVYEYRFLHIDHLSALVNRSYKKVHGRLFKLVQNRFLARIEFRFQKHIYVIGRVGIDVLVEQGIASREVIEFRLRHQELKELFLRHQLMLVDLRCILELACRGTSIRLDTWREGKHLWDRVVTWHDRARVELPVCPDAFFTLEAGSRPEGRNRLNFFLEADRSTSTHKRFQQKLIAYRQYLEDGRHTKKYGIKTFRVVTFTVTEQRAHALSAAAREVLPETAFKYFLFASVQGLSIADPKQILSDIFVTPEEETGAGRRLRLVPMQ
jgi:hypothetical protein